MFIFRQHVGKSFCYRLLQIGKTCLLPSQWSVRDLSQWHLVGSLCLERKPIISQKMTQLESDYWDMLQKMELSSSLLSNHEMQHMEDIETAKRLKSEESSHETELVEKSLTKTAQDIEDEYIEELNKFTKGTRSPGDNSNRKCVQRHLDKTLLLVVQQKLGTGYQWLLPQTIHLQGEALRQSIVRVSKEVCGDKLNFSFFGNAPCGFYKYKYPKAARSEDGVFGAKVFFFKAQVKSGDVCVKTLESNSSIKDYMWLTQSELKEFLKPDYRRSLEKFLIPEEKEESAVGDNKDKEHIDLAPLKSSICS